MQVAHQTNTESVDLHCSLPEMVCAVPRLRKLAPGPSRSLGGYLDYEGWPDRERFMELDRALQHSAQERHNSGGQVDSDGPQALPAVRKRAATFDEGNCSESGLRLTADHAEKNVEKYRTDPSFAEVIRKLEDLPLRRL